jgi:AhpD family alkylhydroperoxidase
MIMYGIQVWRTTMITLPARIEQAVFDSQAPKLIKHLDTVPASTAPELVAQVYGQMRSEFQLVPPVTLHAPHPELLAGVWGMLRETIVAGPVDRTLREVVCEAVSQINQCSFCVDAHSTLLTGTAQKHIADAISADRAEFISDPKIHSVAQWALANRKPGAAALSHPPFSAEDAPELIGSAVCFHYIDRMVTVFLADSPVPLPSWLRWLRGTVIQIAGSTVGKRLMAMHVDPGHAVGSLPEAAPSPEFSWAQPKPAVAAAIGRLEAVVEAEGKKVLPESVRELVAQRVAGWNGEEPGISRSWVEDAAGTLEEPDQPAGRLALLVALAPYQIDETIIHAFRDRSPSDAELLAATAWASFTATRRIAGWLTPAATTHR